ncbi:CHAP domain-containing protein [Saccharopolyspora rhizosphaerae]|uniref:CHAP domain-containing protein n=1 Tax=Saccharopolyspora rhizosphaerae TaxID=2492662 RepID=A0A426JSE5_9PSEU|nr:CHAP domain-containing protein [Saccharopolyspora rhizosphaerae]RRO16090.1 CHAP domain-containing protein [Saccharopolyspora rhizosphaerae]
MRNHRLGRLAATSLATALLAAPLAAHPAVADTPPAQVAHAAATQLSPGDGTAQGAVEWFQANAGDTSYEGLCEMAVENAYGVTGVWPSAIDHWNGAVAAGKAHTDGSTPPAGAFVYWNTSEYGHVGIADGNGGFHSSSVGGTLGHSDSLSYFPNYLGWSDPQVPAAR